MSESYFCFFFQAEDGIRDGRVTGVQTCALPISALKGAARFVVNVLAADQEAISRRFAAEHANRFDGIGYRETRQGLPVLEGVLASIECDKHAEAPGGDHTVFFGLVTGGNVSDRRPLLYYRGGYAGLGNGGA